MNITFSLTSKARNLFYVNGCSAATLLANIHTNRTVCTTGNAATINAEQHVTIIFLHILAYIFSDQIRNTMKCQCCILRQAAIKIIICNVNTIQEAINITQNLKQFSNWK
jgi:hypothetical protein